MPWRVSPEQAGQPLAAFLRERLDGRPWREVRRLVATGKVQVAGRPVLDPGLRLAAGLEVELRMDAPRRPRDEGLAPLRIVHEDRHVVVIDKPAGISSVPSEHDLRSAMELVREAWRRARRRASPLFMVHRIDKPTSGLLVYARTELAAVELFRRFRRHELERRYVAVCEGRLAPQTIELPLLRGGHDGVRWVAQPGQEGKRAVTHVRPLEELPGATRFEARLETGRTHQIRIHLAAIGHPLVGEPFYAARAAAAPGCRLLLHAATLGFPHPVSGAPLRFTSEPPPDFEAVVDDLRRGGGPRRPARRAG